MKLSFPNVIGPFLEGDKGRAAGFIPQAKALTSQIPSFSHFNRTRIGNVGVTIIHRKIGDWWRITIKADRKLFEYDFFAPASEFVRARYGYELPDTTHYVTKTGLHFYDGVQYPTPASYVVDYSKNHNFETLGYISAASPNDWKTDIEDIDGRPLRAASATKVTESDTPNRQPYVWYGNELMIISEAGTYPGGTPINVNGVNQLQGYLQYEAVPQGTGVNLSTNKTVDYVRGFAFDNSGAQAPDSLSPSLEGMTPQTVVEGEYEDLPVSQDASFPLRRVVKTAVGGIVYIIATDSHGKFRVHMEGDEGTAVVVTPTWPTWVKQDSDGPYETIAWNFDPSGLKAVCLPFESDEVVSQAGSDDLYRVLNGLYYNSVIVGALGYNPYDKPQINHPGVFEVSIGIELVDGDIEVTLTTLKDWEPSDLDRWIVDADYSFLEAGHDGDLIFAELLMRTPDVSMLTYTSAGDPSLLYTFDTYGFVKFLKYDSEFIEIVEYPLDNGGVNVASFYTCLDDSFAFRNAHQNTYAPAGYPPWSPRLGRVLGLNCRVLGLAVTKTAITYPNYFLNEDTQPTGVNISGKLYAYEQEIHSTGEDFNQAPTITLYDIPSTDFRMFYGGAHHAIFKGCSWNTLRASPDGHVAITGDMVSVGVVDGTANLQPSDDHSLLRVYYPSFSRSGTIIAGWIDGTEYLAENLDVIAFKQGEDYIVVSHRQLANAAAYQCFYEPDFADFASGQPNPNDFFVAERASSIGCAGISGIFV